MVDRDKTTVRGEILENYSRAGPPDEVNGAIKGFGMDGTLRI
jgi:hypothetical protein